MVKSLIFTEREMKVIKRKTENKKLNQTDSNYLYRFIRPKLREIASIDAKKLLNKLEYNQKIKSIEKKIRKNILEKIEKVDAIVLYGSVVQNNYKSYNDIDILVVTKEKNYEKLRQRYRKIKEVKSLLQKEEINADLQIYDKDTVEYSSLHSPTLIYELKDYKVIYGSLKIPDKKRTVYNADLRMKLSHSEVEDTYREGSDIYHALRNIIVVRLILNKIVDNQKLIESLDREVGHALIERLKNNCESKTDRKVALSYLKELLEKTRKEIKGGPWEKIEL